MTSPASGSYFPTKNLSDVRSENKSGHVPGLQSDLFLPSSLHMKNPQKPDREKETDAERRYLGDIEEESFSCNQTMRTAVSSPSCFLSCLPQRPGDIEHSGSSLSLQQQGHHSDNASPKPQTLYRMAEGDITVMSYGPAAVDLSRQEHQQLTRLYCQNGGHHLRILADGTVSGGRQDNDTYDVLRLKAVGVGVVVIKGEVTARYLAMDKDGRLYGSQAVTDECYFLEKYEENNYNTYRSQKYGWYVGLKRNGKPKAGPKTHQGQKAVFFLPRPAGNP